MGLASTNFLGDKPSSFGTEQHRKYEQNKANSLSRILCQLIAYADYLSAYTSGDSCSVYSLISDALRPTSIAGRRLQRSLMLTGQHKHTYLRNYPVRLPHTTPLYHKPL